MATPIPVHHVISPHCRFRPQALSDGLSDNNEEGSIFSSRPVDPSEWQKSSRSSTGLRQHRKFRGKPSVPKGGLDTTAAPSKVNSFKSNCELNTGNVLETKDEWLDNGEQVLQSFTPSKTAKHHSISNRELQQYFHKFHCDLMKEFKDIKLSLSRQIMNLQLDVDKILANQSQESPERLGFKGLLSHHQGQYGQSNPTGPIDKMDFKTYSSLSTKQEMARPASTSSVTGEDYSLPSSKFTSQHKHIHNMVHDDSWNIAKGAHCSHNASSKRLRNSQIDTRAFQNLQNNPIYHEFAQTNSDNNYDSSDSDVSSSCEEDSKSEGEELESPVDIESKHAGSMEPNGCTHSRRDFVSNSQVATESDEEHRKNLYAEPLKSYGPTYDFENNTKQFHLKSADRQVLLKDEGCNLLIHGRSDDSLFTRHDDNYGKVKTSGDGSHPEHVSQSKISEDQANDDSKMANILEQYSMSCTLRKDHINNLLNLDTGSGHESNCLHKAAENKAKGCKYFSGPILTETARKLVRNDLCFTPVTEDTSLNEVKDEAQSFQSMEKSQNLEHREKFVEPQWTPYTKSNLQYSNCAKGGNEGPQSERSFSGDEEEESHNRKYATMKSKHRKTDAQNDGTSQNQHHEKAKKARRTVLPEKVDDVNHCHATTEQLSETRSSFHLSNGSKQSSAQNEAHALEDHDNVQPFTLKGWSAAFLESHSKASTKGTVQNLTVSSRLDHLLMVSPSIPPPSIEGLQLEKEDEREEPQHKEKENKSNYDQNSLRQLSAKSSKGGCAWTVIEPPVTPKSTLKGAQGNGATTPVSKTRPKSHYVVHN